MRDFTLGIIGGCLTHQGGLPKSQLYHYQLADLLEQSAQVRLRVRVARGFEDIDHTVRLDKLAREHALDAVLVHARNYYLIKSALLVKAVTPEEFRYQLHPFLFKPWRTGWAKAASNGFAGQRVLLRRKNTLGKSEVTAEFAEGAVSEPSVNLAVAVDPGEKRVFGFSMRDWLYAAGFIVGLDRWAVRDEVQMLRDVRDRCNELNLPLFVLGPGRRLDHRWLDRMCLKFDKRLRRVLSDWSVPFCGLPETKSSEGEPIYARDKWHLSAAGHTLVAEKLAQAMISCVRRFVVGAKADQERALLEVQANSGVAETL